MAALQPTHPRCAETRPPEIRDGLVTAAAFVDSATTTMAASYMHVSDRVARDGRRLHRADAVSELRSPRVFEIVGDNDRTYVVVISNSVISCTCRSTVQVCKHVAAAGVQILEPASLAGGRPS